MPDRRIVAKAMNDLGGDWHWVVLHEAEELEPSLYLVGHVDTVCGILLADHPQRVRLFDTGAPPEPTCAACLDDGGPARGLRAEVEELLEVAEAAPAGR